jgi:hypothetical protein
MWWLLLSCAPKVDAVDEVTGAACKRPAHVGDVAADATIRVPPIDLRKPAHTEIATFALG